jgi:hypothetical protein
MPTAAGRWPAQPRVQPGCPSTFSAPLGGLWAAIPGGHCDFRAIARAAGYPGDPSATPPAESAVLRASGTVVWWQAYVGSWGSWLPAAVPGRLNVAVQPAVGGLSTSESGVDSSVGVRVGLLIPKATG